MARYLAVAHQTAESDEFIAAAREFAAQNPDAELVLLVPATPVSHLAAWTEGESNVVAEQKAEAARVRLVEEGVKVGGAWIGDPNPYLAVLDAMNKEAFDAILVSTFKPGISRWLRQDLVKRLRNEFDVPITHVVAD